MKLNCVWLAVVALLESGKWKRWCTNWEGWKQLNLSPFVRMHWELLCVLLIRKQLNPIMVTRPFVRSVLHYLLHPYLQFIQKQFTEIHQNTQQCTKRQTKVHQNTNVLHSAIQNVQWLCNSAEWWMLRTHISLQKAKSFNKKLFLTSRSVKNGQAHRLCHSREW